VCWSIVVKEKPTVFSPIFWAFLPDRILLATKDFIVLLFIYLQFYNFPHAEILVIIPANSGNFLKILHSNIIVVIIGIIMQIIIGIIMQIGGYRPTLSWA
jgi:hypothetical protein